MNARPGNDCPPVVEATEGRSIAVRASAGIAYLGNGGAGKGAVSAREAFGRAMPSRSAFRSLAGRVWRYSGKRARDDGSEA